MRAGGRPRRRPGGPGAATLRVRVSPPELRQSLREHLRSRDCLVRAGGDDELSAQLLHIVSERHDRKVLVTYVQDWCRAHSEARIEILGVG
jgi:hypothetical protein